MMKSCLLKMIHADPERRASARELLMDIKAGVIIDVEEDKIDVHIDYSTWTKE